MFTCEFENGHKTDQLRHVVVHALVIRDNEILLEKRADYLLEAGKWCLPSGFMDRDETATQAVLRELREETGWEGKITHFFRVNSHPDRPRELEKQNVALEYIVEVTEKTGAGDKEAADLKWFPLDKLPRPDEMAFDHLRSIELYISHRNDKSVFPLWQDE